MSKEKTEIIIKDKEYSIAKSSDMANMATVLKSHIVNHGLYTPISGKNYVNVEGWAFAGGLLGMVPEIVKVENMSNDKEKKWFVECVIKLVKDEKIIGRGFAICSNAEPKKKSFDEYAVLSMAQTRAVGKAYRNMIGWVMKLAGYEATPADEMPSDTKQEPKNATPNGHFDIEKAKRMIKGTKNIDGLIEYAEKLNSSKTVSDSEKQILQVLIHEKMEELMPNTQEVEDGEVIIQGE